MFTTIIKIYVVNILAYTYYIKANFFKEYYIQ